MLSLTGSELNTSAPRRFKNNTGVAVVNRVGCQGRKIGFNHVKLFSSISTFQFTLSYVVFFRPMNSCHCIKHVMLAMLLLPYLSRDDSTYGCSDWLTKP